MKKNIGKLSMCEKYTFIEITDLGEQSGLCCCDNCGSPLRYVVTLETSGKKIAHVGTECSKTLQEANITNEYSYNLHIKEFKKIATIRNFINKSEEIKFFGGTRQRNIVVAGKAGKAVKYFVIEPIYDMFIDSELEFINLFIKELYESKSEIIELYTWCYNDVFKYINQLKRKYQIK